MFVWGNHENYIGSSNLQTSVANQEIIPTGLTKVDDFDFYNDQACHVIINGGNPIYFRAGQGFNGNSIWSFKIVENSITYNFVAVQH